MAVDTGLNQTAAQAAIDSVIAGGADVRLMTTALSYSDTATELDSKEVSAADYASVSVAEVDWNVTFDAPNGTATLTNASVVDFGQTTNDYGTVVDVAIHAPTTDKFIRGNEPNDPTITAGEEVQFSAGDITYTLGP